MKARTLIAAMLFAIPAATLSLMSLKLSLHVAVCAVALVGLTGYVDLRHIRWAKTIVFAAIPVAFAAKLALGSPLLIGTSQLPFFSIGLVDYTLAYNVAQGVLCFQAAVLFVGFPGELPAVRLPRLLPLPAALVVILAGVIPTPSLGGWRDFGFQSLSVALAVVTGLYFSTNPANRVAAKRNHKRQIRLIAPAAVLMAIIAVSGWFFAIAIYRFGQDFDLFLGSYVQGRVTAKMMGFSPDGRFGNISRAKDANENLIALSVDSPKSPGYLRGKAFDVYEPPRWLCESQPRPTAPTQPPHGINPTKGEKWFSMRGLDSAPSGSAEVWTVYPSGSFARILFSPLGIVSLGAELNQVSVDDYDSITALESQADFAYRLAVSSPPCDPLPEDARNLMTRVPENLDPRVRTLATEITAGCADDDARILAIKDYLVKSCQYDLAGGPDKAPDPVSAFLLETRKGHCEYFASAAVILMRCAGVPARYVTGFVSDEFNPFNALWIARNKDAHAWAEAYLQDKGWVTVEATPGSGVPTGDVSKFRQFWDFLKGGVRSLVRIVRERVVAAFTGLLNLLVDSSWSIPTGVLLALGAAITIGLRKVGKHRRKPRVLPAPADHQTRILQSMLARMDEREKQSGLVRAPSETLHRFATRIDSKGDVIAADWYRAYAAIRYDLEGTKVGSESLEEKLAEILARPPSGE